ncbi:MAG TPA: hypothetical protein VJZ49_14225 [Syntrophales bacterium]|nr:hypothetical protein [Syntrophales bacterium]
MKKWTTLIKIGVWVFLCLFMAEYLDPSAVGVRAYYDPLALKYYSSLGNNYSLQKKSNPLIWVSADYDHFPENRSDKHCIEKKFIPHAMVGDFPIFVNRAFPEHKFYPVQEIISNKPSIEEIYHPPRLPFSFISI